MEQIKVMITRACNAKCAHCGVESTPSTRESLSYPQFDKIVDFAAEARIDRITVNGGEPTIKLPELDYLIRRAYSRGVHCGFISNGWWGGNEFARSRLAKLAVDCHPDFAISIDNYHSPFIPTSNSFQAVRTAIESAGDCEVITVRSEGDDSIEKLLRFLMEELGEPEHIQKKFRQAIQPDYLNLSFPQGRLRIRFTEAGPIGRAATIQMSRGTNYRDFTRGCRMVLSIDAFGYIKPCCASLGPGFEAYRLGHIDRDSIGEIHTALRKYVEAHGKVFTLARAHYQRYVSSELPALGNSCELCYLLRSVPQKINLRREVLGSTASDSPSDARFETPDGLEPLKVLQ